ncbi:type II CAAX prenyl endopeptidase Rce1 family protein [Acetanaerobacterium elongatum]|uniref:CAAX prenyl protease 2/Lysostaphin resistance protein A-like domain-containing protein n=1 Tax=Acetanaerobacterium elongatum TaxID=258515 RepID=A0A1H0HCE1_9FIRM|nr:CPBP family glutamic-type intramembrane protease [Acetanaerobacterium elongatum]SDO16886.1 hypothetical protein SAMN05192585_1731 [Acetanaerobacterium elongatum]
MKKTLPFILPLFRSILFIALSALLAALLNQSLEETSKWWSVLFTLCNIITILVLLLVCRAEKTTLKSIIGYQKGQLNFKSTILIVLLMLALGMGGMYGFGFLIYGYVPTIVVQPVPVWLAVINAILLPLTVVFAEMPLYFGYSLTRIEEITGNKVLAIGYAVFFYALQHSFMPLLWDVRHILFRFLSFLPLMLVLGILYYRKRKLAPLMVGHGVLDIFTGAQILITSLFPAVYQMMQSAQ